MIIACMKKRLSRRWRICVPYIYSKFILNHGFLSSNFQVVDGNKRVKTKGDACFCGKLAWKYEGIEEQVKHVEDQRGTLAFIFLLIC